MEKLMENDLFLFSPIEFHPVISGNTQSWCAPEKSTLSAWHSPSCKRSSGAALPSPGFENLAVICSVQNTPAEDQHFRVAHGFLNAMPSPHHNSTFVLTELILTVSAEQGDYISWAE